VKITLAKKAHLESDMVEDSVKMVEDFVFELFSPPGP